MTRPALALLLALSLPAAAFARPAFLPIPQVVERPTPEALATMTIEDAQGRALGRASDMVRDGAAPEGISHVLVTLGGFMGLGAHTVAVPYSELRLQEQDGVEVAVIPWTEEQLRAVPPYNPADPATLGLVGPAAAGNTVGMTGTAVPAAVTPEVAPAQG